MQHPWTTANYTLLLSQLSPIWKASECSIHIDHRASLAIGGSSPRVYCVSHLVNAPLAWKALAKVWETHPRVNSRSLPSHDYSFLNKCFLAETVNISPWWTHVHNREAMWAAVCKPHRISQKYTTFVVGPIPGPNFMAQKTRTVKFHRKQRRQRMGRSLKRWHTSLFQSERVKDETHGKCGCLLLLSRGQVVAGLEQLPEDFTLGDGYRQLLNKSSAYRFTFLPVSSGKQYSHRQ